MRTRLFILTLSLLSLLAACGGGDVASQQGGTRLLGASSGATPTLFAGVSADYAIAPATSGYTVTALADGKVTTVPPNARLRFADTTVGLDLDGGAGQGYRLYRAAFDRVPDGAGLGFWVGVMDQGVTLEAVAQAFVGSAEFTSMYGTNPSNANYVNGLYQHVLHRAGDPAGIAYWTGVLERSAASRAQVLAAFGESAENKDAVKDETQNGVAFIEAGVAYVPAAHPGATRFADVGSTVTLDGGASTVAVGKKIQYYWTLAQVPPASKAVLANAGTARPSFTADIEGKYVLKLVVSDGINYSREVSTNVLALWRPADGEVPATGDAFYVKADPGQLWGLSGAYLYTKLNAQFRALSSGNQLQVGVAGDTTWSGWFSMPPVPGTLTRGAYGEFTAADTHNGSASWTAGSSWCGGSGWFVVDDASYQDGLLTAVTIRYEQHCNVDDGAVRGLFRWTRADLSMPPGPVTPVPATLWQPSPALLPSSGNYVYLDSEPGDIGGGKQALYTDTTAKISVQASGNGVSVSVDGPSFPYFRGNAVAMYSLDRLAVGYYPGMMRSQFNNPARGGMDWNVGSTGCDRLSGWFAVDKVTYVGDRMTALDMRFEQHCELQPPALHGKIHWVAGP